jgi:hypothetical protein
MEAIMSGFKDGGQVIVPVPLEFTGFDCRLKTLKLLLPLQLKYDFW